MGFAEQLQNEVDRLREMRQELVSEIEMLDDDLKDCETALRVATRLEAASVQKMIDGDAPRVRMVRGGAIQDVPKFKGQINKLALSILKHAYPRGMTSSDIRQVALDDHGAEIKSTTLTVALGRYKNDSTVRIVGRYWCYVPDNERRTLVDDIFGDEEESAPPEQSSEAS